MTEPIVFNLDSQRLTVFKTRFTVKAELYLSALVIDKNDWIMFNPFTLTAAKTGMIILIIFL